MPLISLFKFVNWITGTPHPIEDGVASAFTLPVQPQITTALDIFLKQETGAVFGASGANHSVGLVPDPGAVAGTSKYLREDSTWAVPTVPPVTISQPQGRLTLTSNTPIMSVDVTAATNIYYTPYVGVYYPRYDGTEWSMVNFSELTLPLDSNATHTGYAASGSTFDLFIDYNGGTPRLVMGPAWTSGTTRSANITRLTSGFWVNDASITVRFGTASGDTATIAANLLTWVGTFIASANGQTRMDFAPAAAAGGSNNRLYLGNAYNEEWLTSVCRNSTDFWNESDDAWHTADRSTSNRVTFVCCQPGIPVRASYMLLEGNTGTASALWTVALDSTTTPATQHLPAFNSTTFALGFNSRFETQLDTTLGARYIQALCRANNSGGGQGFFYGDAGDPSRYQTGLLVSVKI